MYNANIQNIHLNKNTDTYYTSNRHGIKDQMTWHEQDCDCEECQY